MNTPMYSEKGRYVRNPAICIQEPQRRNSIPAKAIYMQKASANLGPALGSGC